MAKNVLRAWLVDNTVTTDDKTDKIFKLETTRSIDKNIILDRMVAKNPGVRRETMALGIELMEEVIAEALMNGESVNTGLFRGVAQFRGVAKQNAWNAVTNSIYVSFTQGKTLREAIKDTRVDVLGERPTKFYIGSGRDAATRATDFSATAGRNFTLFGKNLTVAGTDRYADFRYHRNCDKDRQRHDCAERAFATHYLAACIVGRRRVYAYSDHTVQRRWRCSVENTP